MIVTVATDAFGDFFASHVCEDIATVYQVGMCTHSTNLGNPI